MINVSARVRPAAAAITVLALAHFAPTASAELIYGVTNTQTLISWDSADPGTIFSGVPIQGMQSNETVRGIDFRPAAPGQLFALGSFSRLYTVNLASGVATEVGVPGPFAPALNGSSFGFDFNPTVDRIRAVSNVDQNLRLHPVTGDVAVVDADLQYAALDANAGADPDVLHSAYTNNFAGATTTTLYGIDSGLDILVTQSPPNDGTLNTVGSIGADVTSTGAFDISGATATAYLAVMDVNLSRSTFWTINLATGAGAMVGEFDGGEVITAMSVLPEPTSLALVGVGFMAFGLRRRV